MATPDTNDQILFTQVNSDGTLVSTSATPAELADAMGVEDLTGAPEANVEEVTVTGTYADDDDAIETAINGILAILIAKGLMAEPA